MAAIKTTPEPPQLDPNFLHTLERMQNNVGRFAAGQTAQAEGDLAYRRHLDDVASYQRFATGQEERAAGRRSKEATESDKRRLIAELAQYGIKAEPSMSYSELAGLKRKHLEDVSESVLSAVDLEDQRTAAAIKEREKDMLNVISSPRSGAQMLRALQTTLDDPAVIKSMPEKDRDALNKIILNAKDGDKATIQKAVETVRKNIEGASFLGIGRGGKQEAEYFWTAFSGNLKAAGDEETQIRLVGAMDDLKQLRQESQIVAKKRLDAYAIHGPYLSPERKKEMKSLAPKETPAVAPVIPPAAASQLFKDLAPPTAATLPPVQNMDAIPVGMLPETAASAPVTPKAPVLEGAQAREMVALLNGRRPASRMIPAEPFAAPPLDPRFSYMDPRSNEIPISIIDQAKSTAPVKEEPSTPAEKIEIRRLAEQAGIDPVQGEAALRRGDRNAVLSFNMLLRQVRAMKSGSDTSLPPVGMPR